MASGERHTFFSINRFGSLQARCRFLLVGLLASLLFACTFSFVYRQLDWIIPWQLSDYISIDDAQHSELERRLIGQLQWHCSTQLEEYAEWFRELRATPHPFSRAVLERHYERSNEFWRVLMERLAPDITALLMSASSGQVQELMGNLERRTRELEKQYATAGWGSVKQRRTEKMTEILRRWIGYLTRAQERALDRWAEDLGRHSGADWIESRRRWQRALAEALAMRDEPERFARRIHLLFVEPERLWPASYRQEYERLRVRTLDMLEEIAAAETPAQRNYFNKTLLAWVEDFETLACRPPADERQRGRQGTAAGVSG